MKSQTLTIAVFLCSLCALLKAQESDYSCWQARLDDNRAVSTLSIPGAHNAATGEGIYFFSGLGKTQELTLSELWDCGIRAFDLRVAVSGEELHIYHGIAKCKLSFNDAIDVICEKLSAHPQEFAIVLLREEGDSENSRERALWAETVGEAIASLGEKAANFSTTMTVGDLRGKILFLTRNEYIGCKRGALIRGWSHAESGTTDGEIASLAGDDRAQLYVQDFFDTTDKERQRAKETAVTRFLSLAGTASANVWTINFLSAYSSTLLGFTPFATTSGYKRNATRVNSAVARCLAINGRRATGILFMDFAGVDKARGGLWHWAPFQTEGKKVTELIIESNF